MEIKLTRGGRHLDQLRILLYTIQAVERHGGRLVGKIVVPYDQPPCYLSVEQTAKHELVLTIEDDLVSKATENGGR